MKSSRMSRLASGAAGLAAMIGMPAGAVAQQGPQYYGPHMWDHGWYFGPIMMILFFAVVVVVVVLLVRWLGGPGHHFAPHAPTPRTSLDILKERFARGEIDKDEFEERRRVLGE